MALKDQPGMVQCICSYSLTESPNQVRPSSRELTHNILLEYGELDLDEFFADFDPPVHPLEIIGFWQKFLKTADALHKVHYPNLQNRDKVKESLHG